MNVFFNYKISEHLKWLNIKRNQMCTRYNPAHNQIQPNAIRRLLPVWWIASHRLGSAPLRTWRAPWPATGAHGRIWWQCGRPVLRFSELSKGDTVAYSVWRPRIAHGHPIYGAAIGCVELNFVQSTIKKLFQGLCGTQVAPSVAKANHLSKGEVKGLEITFNNHSCSAKKERNLIFSICRGLLMNLRKHHVAWLWSLVAHHTT